jgi:hypothetical protein
MGIRSSKSFSTEFAPSRSVRIGLRALAVQKLLQLRKYLRRRLALRPAIRACRSGNNTFKDQLADIDSTKVMSVFTTTALSK